jgi:hypothetical protein
MNDLRLREPSPLDRAALERVNYFPRQLLGPDDMITDQEYFRLKLRRHNRFLHGWGVVCGLVVTPAPTEHAPWRINIGEGYALCPYGNEIFLGAPIFLDLAHCGPGAATDPCEPELLGRRVNASNGELYVAIKYAECVAQPVRAMPAGCACEEEICEYSRIRDSFEIECLTDLPSSHLSPAGPLLCELVTARHLPECPPCAAEPWVVLAHVTLPGHAQTIDDANIHNLRFGNFARRQIFSTAVLQSQLIKCCCHDRDAGGLPDLVPVSQSENYCDRAEEDATLLLVTVRNQGTARAGASTTRVVFSPGTDRMSSVDVPTPALEVNEQVTHRVPIPDNCFRPGCQFTITVNAGTAPFPELNMDNNTVRGRCTG